MSSKRMTANPVKPTRYRPGKPTVEEHSAEEEEEEYQEDELPEESTRAPPPKVTSFSSDATKIASNLKKVNLSERRRQAAAEEAGRIEAEKAARAKEEEGFVTEESEEEEEEEEEDSDDAPEDESGSEESSSEDEALKIRIRPTFIKKDQRKPTTTATPTKTEDDLWAEEQARRKAKADALIQDQLEKNAAAAAAGKKNWDDDEENEADQVDDTDGLNPETERAAWKLRELKRVKREREAIELAEKEREELDRRRNLSKEERDAEDRSFIETQKHEREGKGKMSYMQKYFHKGAFFQDDAKAEGLDRRDIMGSRYADDVQNRELLPQYMQIRDMTRLGRKGRTKYKDLKSEDTGRYGEAVGGRGSGARRGGDERFRPDRDGGRGGSGANTTQVGERRRAPERPSTQIGEGEAKRESRFEDDRSRAHDSGRRSPPRRSYQRSSSPLPRRDHHRDDRQRSYARSRSPPPRKDHLKSTRQRSRSTSPPPRRNHRRRSYSHSRSRSSSPRYRDDRTRRKRSPSPHREYESEKRRRVEGR